MFVVLQSESISDNLNEAIVQMTDLATCNAAHSGSITDRMVCTVPPSGLVGPCFVRVL